MRVVPLKDEDVKGSLLLVAYPGAGLVGPIATSYVIQELGMWPIAAVVDDRLPPTTTILNGGATPPLRLFVSAEKCGPDGTCDKLVIFHPEIPLDPGHTFDLARCLLDWAIQNGIQHVLTLEGLGTGDDPDAPVPPMVRGINGSRQRLDLAALGVEPMPNGIVSSHTSAMHIVALDMDVDVASIFVGATGVADPAAASEALKHIDPVLPHLDLGSDEFAEKVGQHQKLQEGLAQTQASQMQQLKRGSEMMYH